MSPVHALAHDAAVPDATSTVLSICWRYKAWLLGGGSFGAGIGVVLALLLPPVFQSSAMVLVIKKRPDALTGVDTRPMGADEYLSPTPELMKSTLIVEQAIRERKLDTLSLVPDDPSDLADVIRKGLTVLPIKAPVGQPNVFKLTFRSSVQADCPVVLEAVLASFKSFIDQKFQAVSADTIELILNAKEALQRELAGKEEAYRHFLEQYRLLGKGKDGVDPRQERLNSIQAKRSALLLHRLEVEGQLAAVETGVKEGRSRAALLAMLAEFARKETASEAGRDKQLTLEDQLFPLLIEERKLLDLYGPKHQDVLAVRARIEVARRLLLLPWSAWSAASADNGGSLPADPIELHVQLLKQKVQHLKASEEQYARVFQAEHEEASRLATFEIQDESFRTSIALSKQMYETLVKRLGDVGLIRNVGGYDVEAMEPPSVAVKVAPSLRLLLVLGILLGGLAALGSAYGFEARRNRQSPNVIRPPYLRDPVTVGVRNGSGES